MVINRSKDGRFLKGSHWRERKPYWDKEWLYNEYCNRNKSANDIAKEQGITENGILFWLKKHNIKTRIMTEVRKIKKWGLSGKLNGMYNRRGKDNPRWRGGITPDRQSFYCSEEWVDVCKSVWKRDHAECQRCGVTGEHIHHIVSFEVIELRAKLDNLVLLCKRCHNWVHSKKNIGGEFIERL